MTIAFVTNMLNLHQSYLADELYKLSNGNFTFIEVMKPLQEDFTKLPANFDIYKKKYYLPAWRSEDNNRKAMMLCKTVDVLLSGSGTCVLPYETERLKLGKLTFEPAERQMKQGILNAFSRTSLSYIKMYYTAGHKNLYKLCASAFTANDMYFLHPFFKGKCYKWAYFTIVPEHDICEIITKREKNEIIKIFSIARFINWKRMDLPIKMAKQLKNKGYKFELNIVGEGELKLKLENLIKDLSVEDCVNLLGRRSNEEVYSLMKQHDIFVFTSNKREGWGAVLNEAMSNGCACVVSDLIGAAQYLIEDGNNGFLFKTGSVESLVSKVELIINDDRLRETIQYNAYNTMQKTWNPHVAASNFIRLAESIIMKNPITIESGPCSLAEPIKGKTFAK